VGESKYEDQILKRGFVQNILCPSLDSPLGVSAVLQS
jgi:hypothetical protein